MSSGTCLYQQNFLFSLCVKSVHMLGYVCVCMYTQSDQYLAIKFNKLRKKEWEEDVRM